MKKTLCIVLSVVCIMAAFCGCDSLNKQPATLADSISIPDDGIISSSVFETLKDENKAVTFKGSSGDIRYEWTVFGSDIKEPRPLDLRIEVTESGDERIVFNFLSEENFGFSPMLSIYLNGAWQAGSATADNGADNTQKVSLTIVDKHTVLNFSPKTQTGRYVIIPDTEQDDLVSSVPESGSAAGAPLAEDKTYSCTFSIECTTIFNHLDDLEPEKLDILPKDGILFSSRTVQFYEGESVYDVLQRICQENRIPMESSVTPMYNSAYIEGIGNLYQFDCGSCSGWMYCVDGKYPNYGSSRYQLKPGETVEWRYTCDLGYDIGGDPSVFKQ